MMKDRYLRPRKIEYHINDDGDCRPICPHGESSYGVMLWVGSWLCDDCQYNRGKTPTHVICVRKPEKEGVNHGNET